MRIRHAHLFGFMTVVALIVAGTKLYGHVPGTRVAQLPEQHSKIKLDMNEVFDYIDKYSIAYVQGISERRKSGQFFLSDGDTRVLQSTLNALINSLEKVSDDGEMRLDKLTEQNRRTFQMALQCDQCGAEANESRWKEPPKTISEIKKLLIGRCRGIQKIIAAGKKSKDLVLQLERHMFYLRQIAIAYYPNPSS